MIVAEQRTPVHVDALSYSDTLVTVQVHTPDESDAHKNQYVFCGNNPVNYRDPFGLCEDKSGWVAAGLLGAMFPWSGSSQMNYLWGQIQNVAGYMRNFPVGSQAWQGLSGHLQGLHARLAATTAATYTAAGHITGYGALGLTGAGSALPVVAIGGLAIGTAAVGGGVGYGVSQIPAGPNGQTVGEFWGGVLYDVAPGFWNSLAD